MPKAAGLYVELAATTARLEKDLKKAVGLFEGFQKDIGRINKIVGSSFAYTVGKDFIRGVETVGRTLVALAEKGDELNDVRAAFEKLGGSATQLAAAEAATRGLVSSFELLRNQTALFAKNVPGVNQNFAMLAEFATKFAAATGGDAVQSLEKLSNALAKGSAKALKQFGIVIEKGETYAQVFAKIAEQSEKLADINLGVFDSVTILTNAWDNLFRKIGAAIDDNKNLADAFQDLARSLGEIDGSALIAVLTEAVALAVQLLDALTQVVGYLSQIDWEDYLAGTVESLGGPGGKAIADAIRGIHTYNEAASALNDKVNAATNGGKNTIADKIFGKSGAADKVAKEFARATKQIQDGIDNAIEKSIQRELLGAIKTNDFARFESELSLLLDRTADHLIHKYADALAAGVDTSKVFELMSAELSAVEIEWREQWKSGAAERWRNEAEEAKRALEETADYFSSAILDAMRGTLPPLKAIFEEIAAGFAGQLFAQLSGIQFNGNFTGLGQSLASNILGGGSTASIGGLAAIGGSLGGYAGGFISGLGGTVGPVASGAQYSGMLAGSNAMATIGPALPYVAAALAVYAVLDKTGVLDGGPTHPDTLARKKVEAFIQDKTGKEWKFGPSGRFDSGGFDYFNTLNDQQREVFKGIGEGVKSVLGITEDIGPQIGAILAENLNGNLDDAKKLVRDLGIAMDEMIAAVVTAGLEANQSLLEIQSNIQGIEAAYSPGIEGKGNVAGAFADYIESLNKGQDALQALRDIFVEAREAGVTTLEELGALLAQSFPADEVAKFIQAASDFGIKDLAEFENAGERTLIALGAHVEALGFQFEKLRDKIAEANAEMQRLETATQNMQSTDSALRSIDNVSTISSDGIQTASARGTQVFIDARNAAPGVSQEIERSMRAVIPSIVNESLRAVHDSARRGGSYAGGY